MKQTLEREIKLTPSEGFSLPELGASGFPSDDSSRPTTTRPTTCSRGTGSRSAIASRTVPGSGSSSCQRGAPHRARGGRARRRVRPSRCSRSWSPIFASATSGRSLGCARGARGSVSMARRSCRTRSPCSRGSGSSVGSTRSRSSFSTGTKPRCEGSRSYSVPPGRRHRVATCSKTPSGARSRGPGAELRPRRGPRRPQPSGLRWPSSAAGCCSTIPGPARRGSRGSPPVSRRDETAAGLPA